MHMAISMGKDNLVIPDCYICITNCQITLNWLHAKEVVSFATSGIEMDYKEGSRSGRGHSSRRGGVYIGK